ncbi:M28 family peptidase [Desertivirga arenae]|uniref:M28 family peptidase n=1 Tax=Desertivirga arenae TaxID=2810309 RepID=UPI001A9740A9|nr:M28 family peptidase [Pedobacter sp. SYSU D00823]
MLKKSIAASILISALASNSYAQVDPVAVKYSSYIDTISARKHLSILASDEFEGRETGKPGAAKAANYLAEEFKRLGLAAPVNGSYFQKVGLEEKALKFKSFTVNGKPLVYLQDFYARSVAKPVSINTSEIVFVGYGISDAKYDDLKGLDIKGKVVMVINYGEPSKNGTFTITGTKENSEWSKNINKRFDLLRSKQPALILAVNERLAAYLQTNKGHVGESVLGLKKEQATAPAATPIIQITNAAADQFLKPTGKTFAAIQKQIDTSGKPASRVIKVRFNTMFGSQSKDVEAVNVMGYLEGSDLKDEVLVLSAHYDHVGLNPAGPDKVFNGADDDGSGTTGVLELAEAFTQAKKEGKGPRRSILFLLVVGEEKGLLGSEWYSDHPVFPLKNTITDLNIDMIGRVDPLHKADPNYCYLIGSDKLSTDLHKISENANSTYTNLKIDYKYNDPNDPERIYYRSDHYNFAKHGIPIIFYFNGVHEDYHQVGDEVSKIDFPMLVKRASLVYYTAWNLVQRAKAPVVDVHKD